MLTEVITEFKLEGGEKISLKRINMEAFVSPLGSYKLSLNTAFIKERASRCGKLL